MSEPDTTPTFVDLEREGLTLSLPGDRKGRRALLRELMSDRHSRKDALGLLFGSHMTHATTIRCVFEDHTLHLDPRDRTITPAVLEKGHWNRDEFERAMNTLVHAGDLALGGLFLDVGANIGTQTLYALKSFRFGRVRAYEPDPVNADHFRLNMDENPVDFPVVLRACAVGRESGRGRLVRHPTNFGAHRLMTGDDVPANSETHDVDVISLDDDLAAAAIAPEDISLMWIDVEGAEPDVIAGASRIITAGRPLVFEFLDRDRERDDVAEMMATLRSHYSYVVRLQDEGITRSPIDTLTPAAPQGDYLVWREL
ncbi:MAG: FkbM family methyltransferase [Pseudomonadota bacterium]